MHRHPAPLPSRRVAAVALLLLVALAAGACAAGGAKQESAARTATPAAMAASATPAPFPFTFKGSDGADIRLEQPPARIVSLSAGMTETLFAVGAGGSVVAVDRFSDYPEAARALPKVEYTRPSIEALTGFRPDLIIASGRQKDTVAAMQGAGLPVALLEEPGTVQGVLERVRLAGRITGHGEDGDRLAAAMEARIRAVREQVATVAVGPRVFHELSAQLITAAPSSFVGDLYTLLKAQNVADGSGRNPFPQISQEVIVQRDPEVIVLADGQEGVTVETVRARPGWGGASAVRSGRVYVLTPDEASIVSRPGPRVVDALELLHTLLYPR